MNGEHQCSITCHPPQMAGPQRLPFPDELQSALEGTRASRVHEQWIGVNPRWWDDALMSRGLPGGPLRVTYDSNGRAGISRAAIFELADAMTPEEVLRLLFHSLAWGGGRRARLMSKRLDSISADHDRAVEALSAAAEAAKTSPARAYDTLYPSGRTLLKYLGPAFFTKFLYFAGGGAATHPCVILDRVTAGELRARGWDGLRSTGWSVSTYVQYCELLSSWAQEAAERLGRLVAVDEVERWLFQP